MSRRTSLAISLLAPAVLLISACGGESSTGPILLKGAGASAPYLIYEKWVQEFNAEFPDTKIEYTPAGSGEGIRLLEAQQIDFAASDMSLSDADLARFPVKLLHFPTFTGAIVPVYNVPEVFGDLRFTGEALAGIFMGRIKMWNDPAIASANANATLPAQPIVVVHRSDVSGSTHALTEYLAQASPAWKDGPGEGASVEWPAGEAVEGSEALAAKVKETPYAIGYVELNYAIRHDLKYGAVRNSAGEFRAATFVAQNAAVRAKPELLTDYRVSVVNASARDAYPITTVTWLIVPSEIPDKARQAAMKRFLRWGYDAGIKLANQMDYGILPPELMTSVGDQVERIH